MKFSALPFKCPSCGSFMVHKINTFHLECTSCKTTKAIDATVYTRAKSSIYDAFNTPANSESKVIDCPGCGADIDFKKQQISTLCPYCKTPLVTQPINSIKPYSILPFSIDSTSAKEIFKNWLGSLFFAPNSLKKLLDFEYKFKPLYLPYYSFDSKTFTNYSGERGDAYYIEVQREVYINGKVQVVTELERHINWSYVSGSTHRDFYDILINSKSDLPDIVKQVYNFDLNRLMLYNPAFLSGFESFEYNRELEICYKEAKEYMNSVIYSDVLYSIGGDEQRVHSIDSNFNKEVFEVTMLPIWMSSFNYKSKEYNIAINGVTGEIFGERPYSYTKIFITILIVVMIILGLFYLDNTYNTSEVSNYIHAY